MILFYRSCLFNLCSVTTSTQPYCNWLNWLSLWRSNLYVRSISEWSLYLSPAKSYLDRSCTCFSYSVFSTLVDDPLSPPSSQFTPLPFTTPPLQRPLWRFSGAILVGDDHQRPRTGFFDKIQAARVYFRRNFKHLSNILETFIDLFLFLRLIQNLGSYIAPLRPPKRPLHHPTTPLQLT